MLAFAESIQLIPDGTLLIHIVIIISMVFVLNRLLFKPINKILNDRERLTTGSSTEAHGILRRVEEVAAQSNADWIMSSRRMLRWGNASADGSAAAA